MVPMWVVSGYTSTECFLVSGSKLSDELSPQSMEKKSSRVDLCFVDIDPVKKLSPRVPSDTFHVSRMSSIHNANVPSPSRFCAGKKCSAWMMGILLILYMVVY